jgi:DNA uptake protein ComE-like DNA-binding protein
MQLERTPPLRLRVSGYRVSTNQPGHHARTIDSLELTLGADNKVIRKMKAPSQKRNATSYDTAGNVSRQELELAIRMANELHHEVTLWMRNHHSELLEAQ